MSRRGPRCASPIWRGIWARSNRSMGCKRAAWRSSNNPSPRWRRSPRITSRKSARCSRPAPIGSGDAVLAAWSPSRWRSNCRPKGRASTCWCSWTTAPSRCSLRPPNQRIKGEAITCSGCSTICGAANWAGRCAPRRRRRSRGCATWWAVSTPGGCCAWKRRT